MSLVNQVLKDLEQRHAAEMQSQEVDITDLHYASVAAPQKKRNYRWFISATLLIIAGVFTAASVYLFEAWDTQKNADAPIANHIPAAQPPQAKTDIITPVAKAQIPQTTQSVPVAEAKPVTTKASLPAETTPVITKASTKPVNVSRQSEVVATEVEEPGTLAKNFVPLPTEKRADLAYQEGHGHIIKHDYRKAESALRNALALEPAHLKAREMLAGVYISQGRWIEASELLRVGVSIAPQHATFNKLYARSLMQLKRDSQAIALLSSNKPPVAQDTEHYALLAALHQRQQNHELAARLYSDILKLQPNMGIWWVGMGISLEAMGDQKQATAAYQQARKTGTLNGDVAQYTDNRLLALGAIKYPMD